jgi:hypothetical protein
VVWRYLVVSEFNLGFATLQLIGFASSLSFVPHTKTLASRPNLHETTN